MGRAENLHDQIEKRLNFHRLAQEACDTELLRPPLGFAIRRDESHRYRRVVGEPSVDTQNRGVLTRSMQHPGSVTQG
jgi:hypothetical protein